MFKKVMVPLDGSKEAEKALEYLPQVTSKAESEIWLLRVVQYPVTFGEFPISQEILDSETQLADTYLTRIQSDLRNQGYKVERTTKIADPVSGVLDASDEANCDLIVMTSHGRTGVGRFLMGSVAERVCRYANCPLLIVGRASIRAKPTAEPVREPLGVALL